MLFSYIVLGSLIGNITLFLTLKYKTYLIKRADPAVTSTQRYGKNLLLIWTIINCVLVLSDHIIDRDYVFDYGLKKLLVVIVCFLVSTYVYKSHVKKLFSRSD